MKHFIHRLLFGTRDDILARLDRIERLLAEEQKVTNPSVEERLYAKVRNQL